VAVAADTVVVKGAVNIAAAVVAAETEDGRSHRLVVVIEDIREDQLDHCLWDDIIVRRCCVRIMDRGEE